MLSLLCKGSEVVGKLFRLLISIINILKIYCDSFNNTVAYLHLDNAYQSFHLVNKKLPVANNPKLYAASNSGT